MYAIGRQGVFARYVALGVIGSVLAEVAVSLVGTPIPL
jgi:hypothetical protein